MTSKPIVPRSLAHRDVEAAVDYYVRQAGAQVALGFIDALQAAYRTISNHPANGSSHYAPELALPSLRSFGLKRYPYLVFYVERGDHVDIWRVLHAQRDIPARMQESGG